MATSAAARIIDRLNFVRPAGPSRWVARCPAHQDRSPSLSIRELDDGRILVHDFGGCPTGAVLEALGLAMSDLFSEPLPQVRDGQGYPPTRLAIPARDLLLILDHEITVAWLILADVVRDRIVTDTQLSRLAQAGARVGAARDVIVPAEVRRHA